MGQNSNSDVVSCYNPLVSVSFLRLICRAHSPSTIVSFDWFSPVSLCLLSYIFCVCRLISSWRRVDIVLLKSYSIVNGLLPFVKLENDISWWISGRLVRIVDTTANTDKDHILRCQIILLLSSSELARSHREYAKSSARQTHYQLNKPTNSTWHGIYLRTSLLQIPNVHSFCGVSSVSTSFEGTSRAQPIVLQHLMTAILGIIHHLSYCVYLGASKNNPLSGTAEMASLIDKIARLNLIMISISQTSCPGLNFSLSELYIRCVWRLTEREVLQQRKFVLSL